MDRKRGTRAIQAKNERSRGGKQAYSTAPLTMAAIMALMVFTEEIISPFDKKAPQIKLPII
jgi:hypothetical protein